MNYKKQLGKNIIALLLFVALMLPTVTQFIHLFENHKHVVCNDYSTHIHKTETKCEICSFNLASFNYKIADYSELLFVKIPTTNDANLTSLVFHSFKVTNTQLRAPPVSS